MMLFLHAADIDALGEVLLDEGINNQNGNDGADDQCIDHGVGGIDLIPAGHGFRIGVILQLQADEDLQRMLVGVGDHLTGPEIAIPAGNCEEQSNRRDGGLAHGDVDLGKHLEFGSAVHNGGFFDIGRHALERITQQHDVHGRHTHGDDHQPLVVHRNFVLCLRVKIDPNLGEYTFEEILRSVSLQLKLANDKKLINSLMTENLKLERHPVMKYFPLPLKNLGVGISFAITGEQTTSTLVSNLGAIRLPEDVSEHIEKLMFFTGAGLVNGSRCASITFKDNLVFSFSNCYKESDLEREFFTRLVKMGVHVKIESNRD